MDTEFYLAGSLAFLIALLGWGDQIRGTQEKTRILERELLETHNFRWSALQPLIRPGHADQSTERLASLLRILGAGGLTKSIDVSLLALLENLNQIRNRLESRYKFRFWLVFAIAVEMFIAGILSIFLHDPISLTIPLNVEGTRQLSFAMQTNHIFAGGWMLLVAGVLYQTFRLNLDEEELRMGIGEVDDQLREAKDERAEDS